MGKLLKMLAALAAAIGFGLTAASAQGTANPLPGATAKIYQNISAAEMSGILAEFGITSELVTNPDMPNQAPSLFAQTPGGVRFIVSLLNCLDVATAGRCNDFFLITAMPGAGFTFEELNLFNGTADAARAVYDTENQMVLFSAYAIVAGGAGHENIKLYMYRYFENLNTFFSNRDAASTSVSFNAGQVLTGPRLPIDVLSVPLHDSLRHTKRYQIAAAVHNKWSGRFPSKTDKVSND